MSAKLRANCGAAFYPLPLGQPSRIHLGSTKKTLRNGSRFWRQFMTWARLRQRSNFIPRFLWPIARSLNGASKNPDCHARSFPSSSAMESSPERNFRTFSRTVTGSPRVRRRGSHPWLAAITGCFHHRRNPGLRRQQGRSRGEGVGRGAIANWRCLGRSVRSTARGTDPTEQCRRDGIGWPCVSCRLDWLGGQILRICDFRYVHTIRA